MSHGTPEQPRALGEPPRTDAAGRCATAPPDHQGGRGGRREFALDEAGESAPIVHAGDDRDERGRWGSGRCVTSATSRRSPDLEDG